MKYLQDIQTEKSRRYWSQELRGNPGTRGMDLGLNSMHSALNAMSIWYKKRNRAGSKSSEMIYV